jgi:hypothetical protein
MADRAAEVLAFGDGVGDRYLLESVEIYEWLGANRDLAE